MLDSWRGIAALAIVAFHFRTTVGLNGLSLFDGMYLFVDFFFVLSGFVISSAYGERLRNGYSVARFMWLRLGRVYPLHLAILLAFIAMQVMVTYPRSGDWFPAPNESFDTVLANLALVHSLNTFDFLTWNKPSWSISVEFYTYLLFALAAARAGQRTWLIGLGVIAAAPLFLLVFNHGKNIDATATFGIVRCLYGFAVGVLAWEVRLRWPESRTFLRSRPFTASFAELALAAIVLMFVATVGTTAWSLLAPMVFGAAVLVFAAEGGALSRVLTLRPFVLLGTVSYSVYMVHMLILSWWLYFVRAVLFKLGGPQLFQAVQDFTERHVFLAGQNWTGLVLMLAVVVLASWVTYTLIERPGREWSRRITMGRMEPTKAN